MSAQLDLVPFTRHDAAAVLERMEAHLERYLHGIRGFDRVECPKLRALHGDAKTLLRDVQAWRMRIER